eukprot:1775061-Amphidinium_carterae.1
MIAIRFLSYTPAVPAPPQKPKPCHLTWCSSAVAQMCGVSRFVLHLKSCFASSVLSGCCPTKDMPYE